MALINGTATSDSLTGTAGDDTINGLGGDDTIDGGAGNDSLSGGDGNDRFVFKAAANYGTDRIDGGNGSDIVSFEGAGASGIVVDLRAGTLTGGGPGGSGSATLTSIEAAIGTSFADRLVGSDTGFELDGRGGNDTIIGGDRGGYLTGGE